MPRGGKKDRSGHANSQNPAEMSEFKFDFGAVGASSDSKQKKDGKALFSLEQNQTQGVNATAALLPVVQQKLGKLVGQSSGYFESLPKSVQKRIAALKKLNQRKVELDKEFKKELSDLESKYNALFLPLYQKRAAIVDGTEEPEEETDKVELGTLENGGHSTPKTKEESSQSEEHIKGVPGFWLEALKHHDAFNEMITERDEGALNFLRDVKSNPVQGESSSFALEFYFNPNPYFDNTIIKKTYHLVEKDSGQVLFDRVESTEINWKNGKNLTKKLVTKQQGGKKSGRGGGKRGGRGQQPSRTVTVEEPCDSFFNFFNPEASWTDDIDEEEKEALLEDDYDLGLEIRDEIIPCAVLWYTGEKAELIGAYLNDEDDDDEEDEDDDDEEQDDEDQSE